MYCGVDIFVYNITFDVLFRLCAVDGTPLQGPMQLENNQYYVAVGAEKFRSIPYYHWVPSKGIIRDFNLLGHG